MGKLCENGSQNRELKLYNIKTLGLNNQYTHFFFFWKWGKLFFDLLRNKIIRFLKKVLYSNINCFEGGKVVTNIVTFELCWGQIDESSVAYSGTFGSDRSKF